jgi:hypothetical protein
MRYFDGYCPQCEQQGSEVPMRLNTDDFWECPVCRLQVVTAAPLAGILRWRGEGQWKTSHLLATETVSGLALAGTGREEHNETLPDTGDLLQDDLALEWYLHEVHATRAGFAAHQFHSKDPVFATQAQHLQQLKPEQWQLLFESYRQFSQSGIRFNIRQAPGFRVFEQYLRQFGILFEFHWQAWHQGWINIRNIRYPFSRASLLELSMYLSAIFGSEPFDEGTVEFYANNKTLEHILNAIEEKVTQ